MADISIVKLKVRRGLDSQRQRIILDQGELAYTIDTKRVFIGDGFLSGGNIVGNLAHPPLTITDSRVGLVNAIKGDIVNENGYLYQLISSDFYNLSSWQFIGTNPDNISIQYNGNRQLTLKSSAVSAINIHPSVAYSQGGLASNPSFGLSANVDPNTLKITTNNQLSVFKVDQNHIKNASLGYGLLGGDGDKISVDTSLIAPLSSLQNGVVLVSAGSVGLSAINSTAIGPGIQLSAGAIAANIRAVDSASITLTPSTGQLSFTPIVSPSTTTFENVSYNQFGQIINKSSTMVSNLSVSHYPGVSASLFNGFITQSTLTNQAFVSALSTNGIGAGVMKLLYSAGFMVITTQLGDIAVPIYKIN